MARSFLPSFILGFLFFVLSSAAFGQTSAVQTSDSAHAVWVDLKQEPRELVPLQSLVRYPTGAFDRRIEGAVTLQGLIDTAGEVIEVRVLKSDDPSFRMEAIRAMKSAKFTPAMFNGKPLKVWATRTIYFKTRGN